MLVHLRTRGAVILALVGGMAVLSVTAVSANTARPAAVSSSLTFITSGMSCAKGVCTLGSGNVGASYGQDIAITGGSCGSPCSLPVFTVVAGKLPPGLSLPSTFGCCGDAIGGTPALKRPRRAASPSADLPPARSDTGRPQAGEGPGRRCDHRTSPAAGSAPD